MIYECTKSSEECRMSKYEMSEECHVSKYKMYLKFKKNEMVPESEA